MLTLKQFQVGRLHLDTGLHHSIHQFWIAHRHQNLLMLSDLLSNFQPRLYPYKSEKPEHVAITVKIEEKKIEAMTSHYITKIRLFITNQIKRSFSIVVYQRK